MTGRASPGKCATRTGPCVRSSRDFDTYTTFDILPPSRFFQPIPKWERRYSADLAGFIKCLDKVAVVMVNSPMLARRLHHSPRRKPFPCIALRTLDLSLRSFSAPRPFFSTTFTLFSQNTRVGDLPVSTFFSPPFSPPPSYAPRGASIPCGLSRLRILPVTTGVVPPKRTLYPLWQSKFARPLFSYSYKSLFPQPLSFHIHTNPRGCHPSAGRRDTHTLAKSFRIRSYENTRDGVRNAFRAA